MVYDYVRPAVGLRVCTGVCMHSCASVSSCEVSTYTCACACACTVECIRTCARVCAARGYRCMHHLRLSVALRGVAAQLVGRLALLGGEWRL